MSGLIKGRIKTRRLIINTQLVTANDVFLNCAFEILTIVTFNVGGQFSLAMKFVTVGAKFAP